MHIIPMIEGILTIKNIISVSVIINAYHKVSYMKIVWYAFFSLPKKNLSYKNF